MTVRDIPFQDLGRFLFSNPPNIDLPARHRLESGVTPSDDEKRALLLLLKHSEAKNVFEFGTCVGATTRLMAENATDAKVMSIDLAGFRMDEADEHERMLTGLALQELGSLASGLPNVELLRGDSRKYDYSAIPKCDFIFIDGGHDYETVRNDSEVAFRLLNPNNPRATILWHDCGNPMTIGVTRLTDELSESKLIFGALGLTLRFFILGMQ